jgi:hypothetical protein
MRQNRRNQFAKKIPVYTSTLYLLTYVLTASPMKYGQTMMAITPFQNVRCKNPIVNSHPANQEKAEKLWFSIFILSIFS